MSEVIEFPGESPSKIPGVRPLAAAPQMPEPTEGEEFLASGIWAVKEIKTVLFNGKLRRFNLIGCKSNTSNLVILADGGDRLVLSAGRLMQALAEGEEATNTSPRDLAIKKICQRVFGPNFEMPKSGGLPRVS